MRKIRGFKIGKRLVRFTRWILRKNRKAPGYQWVSPPTSPCKPKAISKLLNLGRRLKNGAKSICCSSKPGSGYIPIDQIPILEKPDNTVPKGHLAVYVGQNDGDFHRVLVPVIYFNHPLFGELLREAEEEYGFSHQGGITIPCRFSEFERVKTRIAATGCRRTRKLTWNRHH